MRNIILTSVLSIVVSVMLTLVVTQHTQVHVTTATDCLRRMEGWAKSGLVPILTEPPHDATRPMDTTYAPQGRLLSMPGTKEDR